tara:strand:+ start:201 stop:500 length:300 start_codon:yes stop_codon:yes gene_type:complete
MNMCLLKINKGKLFKNYTWRYLCNSRSAKIAKFKKHMRIGVFGSDWVSWIWGSPIVALAPPSKHFGRKRDARLGLNIGKDQYLGLKTDEFGWAIIYPPP